MIYDQRDLDFHVMWKCCTHRVVSIGLLLLVVSLLRLFNGMNRIIAFTYTRKAKSTATAAKNERSFFPPARKILNSSCNRYSHMLASSKMGMGHRFGEVVLGMMLAQMTNSTFVYDSKTWNVRGAHGGYEWFPEFLPLEETAVTLTDLQTSNFSLLEVDDDFLNLLSRSKGEFKDSCNIIFITSWPKCDGSCFQSSHTGSYNAAKWRLREVHSRSTFEPSNKIFKNLTSQGILSVAWHLRGGDIVLHSSEDFYKNLASELMSVLFDFSYHIFFFGEYIEKFDFIPHFCETVFPNHCTYHHNVSNADTFFHFVVADILVTSGSSFPIAASVFRSSLQPTFSVMPKENSRNFYIMSEDIPIDATGLFNEVVSKDEVIAQIHEYVKMKARMFPLWL